MRRLSILFVLLTLAVVVGTTQAQEAELAKLVVAPEDFGLIEGGRLVDIEGTPTGKAVLIEKDSGFARIILKLGEDGDIPKGLYWVKVQLGTDDGALKWAMVQVYLNKNHGGWFTGFVRPAQAGTMAWREFAQPLVLNKGGELVLEVCSRGATNFYIAQVVLQRTTPYWPKDMMTDAEFFDALDRNYPGLENVIAAADARDYDTACTELVAHLRKPPAEQDARLWGVIAAAPPAKTDKQAPEMADLIMEDKMLLEWSMESGKSNSYCCQENNKIPPTVFSFADPYEWHKIYDYPGRRWYGWYITYNINNLTDAYNITGDEKYARKAMELIKRRIDVWGPFPKAFYYEGGYPNEYYTDGSAGVSGSAPSWNRCSGTRQGLIEALWGMLCATGGSEAITDRERIETLKLTVLMTRYVQNVRAYANGNQPKYAWLIRTRSWLPEFTEIVDMSENGIYALTAFLEFCHYPDGGYYELCYYRHGIFAQAARDAAAHGSDVTAYLDKLLPAFYFNMWLTKPMGNFPWINDAGGGKNVDYAEPSPPGYAGLGLKSYPDDPWLKYSYSFGKEGEPPQPTSKNFPWSGFMVMRSGWQPDDLYLVFDGGRSTGSHQHQDQMNVICAAYGSTLLGDNGYVGTGFRAPDRTHYISHPRGHNLVLVDQAKQTSNYPSGKYLAGWRAWGDEPIPNYWLSAAGYDYAETTYDRSYRKYEADGSSEILQLVKQQRRVLFLKPSTGTPYWILYDIVQPKDEQADDHELQLLFHFTPTSSAKIVESGTAARNTAEKAGLLVLPRSDKTWQASVVRGDARPDELYWQGFVSGGAHNPLVPNDCAIFEYNGTLPAGVATVLYPYPNDGENQASAKLIPASGNGAQLGTDQAFGLDVTVPGGTDIILAAAEPGTMAVFGDFSSDARMAVIRRDAAGKLTSILIIEGTILKSGDQVLIDTAGRTARYVECSKAEAVAAPGVSVNVDALHLTAVEWPEHK